MLYATYNKIGKLPKIEKTFKLQPVSKSMPKKGQASLEQLVVTGIGIAFIAIFFYVALNFATDNVHASQAKDTVDKIAKAADYVYALGPDSKTTIDVYMPGGIESIEVSGNRVYMRISLPSGDADVFANTQAQLNGTLHAIAGAQEITLTTSSNGSLVNING